MPSRSRSHPVVTITGVVYALIGLALAGGGAWLVALGGSLFYLIAGLGILVTGALLVAGRRDGLVGLRRRADRHAGLGGGRGRASTGGRWRRAATSSSRWASGC